MHPKIWGRAVPPAGPTARLGKGVNRVNDDTRTGDNTDAQLRADVAELTVRLMARLDAIEQRLAALENHAEREAA